MVDVTVLGLVLDPTKIEQGAQRAGRAVDDLTSKTDRAARSTDDLQGAGDGAGRSFSDMGPKVERSTKSVDQMGFIAENTAKRLQNLAKASVGIFAVDIVAKVAGFSGAMDVLSKASDAAAGAIRRALGIEQLLKRLEDERIAVENNAKAWEALSKAREDANRSARGQGIEVPSLQGSLFYTPSASAVGGLRQRPQSASLSLPSNFISTEGLSSYDQSLLLRRIEGLRSLLDDLQSEGQQRLGYLLRPGERPLLTGRSEDPQAVIEDLQSRLLNASKDVELFAEGLRDLSKATAIEADNKRKLAEFESELVPLKRIEVDALQRINERRRDQLAGPPRLPPRADALDLTALPLPPVDRDRLAQIESLRAAGDARDLYNFGVPGYRSPSGAASVQEKRLQTEQIEDDFRRVKEFEREVQRVYDNLGQIGANAFEGFITGAQNARDAIKLLGQDIYLYLVRQLITLPLQGALSSGLRSIFPNIGAPIAGFQHGGTIYQPSILMPLTGGRPSLVAEAGPEEITPSYASGRGRGGMGRGGVTIVVNPQAGDTTWRRSLRQVMHDVKRGGIN